MIEIIRLLLKLASIVLGGIGRLVSFSDRNSVVILAPGPQGSRGDAAVLDALICELSSRTDLLITVLSYYHDEKYSQLVERYGVTVRPLATLARRPWTFFDMLGSTRFFQFTATDVVDGVYGEFNALLRIAIAKTFSRAGAESAIINFSLSGKSRPVCLRALRDLTDTVRLVPRDQVSLIRLEKAIGRPAKQGADLAFLLRADATGIETEVLDWIEQQDQADRQLVGLGFNALLYSLGNPEVVQSLTKLTELLIAAEENRSVLFIPHDFRKKTSDYLLSKRIFENLTATGGSRLMLLHHPYDAQQLKYIVSRMDAVISARMHLAIAGLSQAVPAFGLRYHGKFEGLYQHLNLLDIYDTVTVDADDAVKSPEETFDLINSFFLQLDEIAHRVKEQIPKVRSLARENIFYDGALDMQSGN
jgi:polysaccharide pyruvyl transferase WcaK-like protein